MAVYERDLIPALSREMGDTSEPYAYTTNVLFSAINDGVQELNRRGYKQQFTVTGSGDAAYFVPDPAVEEQRAIVLCSAIVLIEGQIAKGATNAIIHSNAAGRTDLTMIPLALTSLRQKLSKQIDRFIERGYQVTDTTTVDGLTLIEGEELKTSASGTSIAEGLPDE